MSNGTHIHLAILKRVFEERKKQHRRYSLRTFAKDLHMHPSTLSDFLKKRRNLSEKLARGIAFHLGLKGDEKNIFLTSVLESRARKPNLKRKYREELSTFLKRAPAHVFELNELEKVNSWIHFAIMELMTFPDYDQTPQYLSKKLDIGRPTVLKHLQSLEAIGWIEKTEKGFVNKVSSAESPTDFPSDAIRQYHKSALHRATQALETQPVEVRDFQSAIFGFNKERTAEAKRFLRDFVERFCLKFNSVQDADRNDVRLLSVQFFSLLKE